MLRQFARASSWLFIGNIAQIGSQLVVFVTLARLLQPGVFGLMATALVVVEILSTLAELGQLNFLQPLYSPLRIHLGGLGAPYTGGQGLN